MKSYDILIAGAGFAGIYAAWRLAQSGATVALIEASGQIGGNLQSKRWKDWWVDNGTHNFDIRTPPGEAFFTDILQDNILIWDNQPWASTTGRSWTPGFEMPDFGTDNPALARAALADLAALQHQPEVPAPPLYLDWYRNTYGPTLTRAIAPMLAKYTGSDPALLSTDARGALAAFSRPKLGSDAQMIALKESSSFWDARLGVSLMSGDARFAGKSVNNRFCYPAHKALTGFCEAAHQRLAAMGVEILTSCAITGLEESPGAVRAVAGDHRLSARRLFWSLPEAALARLLGIEVDLTRHSVPVGTCFYAFEVPESSILGPDYLHDYSASRLPFRYNRIGVYSRQTRADGTTLVTAEAPCHPARIADLCSAENLARAWEGLLDVGYLRPGTQAADALAWGHPVAFTLPQAGWRAAHETADARLHAACPRVVRMDIGSRGRLTFMAQYDTVLAPQLMRELP